MLAAEKTSAGDSSPVVSSRCMVSSPQGAIFVGVFSLPYLGVAPETA
jgi:hypothetical protein